MTGEKNRFKTGEKLWNLDDKQLKTPVHDAMILWLMDEDNLKALLFNCCNNVTYTEYTEENFEINECLNLYLDYESEKPIMSSSTFIAGYADLVVDFRFTKYLSKEECPIDKKWYSKIKEIEYLEDMELLVKEYHNDNSFEFKTIVDDEKFEKCYFKKREDGSLLNIYYEDDCDVIKHRYPTNTNYSSYKTHPILFNLFCDFWKNTVSSEYHKGIKNWIEYGLKYTRNDYGCNCLIEVKPYIDSFGAVLRQINSYKRFYNKRTLLGTRNNHYSYDTKFCLFTFDKRFDKQFASQGIIVLHPWVSKEDMLKMYGL